MNYIFDVYGNGVSGIIEVCGFSHNCNLSLTMYSELYKMLNKR